MLGELRRHSKSFLIYLLFAMIIVVFIFTFNTGAGKGGGCGGQETPVYSEVGSVDIDLDTYVMGVRLLPGYMRTPEGTSFALAAGIDLQLLANPELEEMSPGQASAFMALIEIVYLAAEEARKLGIRVDDDEMKAALYSGFYKEEEVTDDMGLETIRKVFDQERYRNFITYRLHASEKEYEGFTRAVLLAFKLHGIMSNTVQEDILGKELLARGQEHKANLNFVAFSVEDFQSKVPVTDEEIDAFVEADSEKIQSYYDRHPADFKWETGSRLLGILVAPEEAEATEEEEPKDPKVAAKENAEKILRRLKGQEELFPGNTLPIELDPSKGTLTLSSADLNRPVPTDPVERFKEVAKRESDDTQTRPFQGQFLGWMSPAGMTARLDAEMAKAVQDAPALTVVGPFETDKGYWILMTAEKREAKDLTLDEARKEIAAKLIGQTKGAESAQAAADTLQVTLAKSEEKDIEKALEQLAQRAEFKDALVTTIVEETGLFSLTQTLIPRLRDVSDVKEDILALTMEAPVAPKVYQNKDENTFYVITLKDRQYPPETLSEDKLEQAAFMADLTLRAMYYPAWLSGIHEKALEEGRVSRTPEFNNYLAALEQQLNEQLQKKLLETGIPVQ